MRLKGTLDQAENYHRKLKELATARKDDVWISRANNSLGLISLQHAEINKGNDGKYKERLAEARQLFEIAESSAENDETLKAAALSNKGEAARMENDFGGAIQIWERTLEIERRIGRPNGIATDLENLASVHIDRARIAQNDEDAAPDLNQARAYLEEARKIGWARNDRWLLAQHEASLGRSSALCKETDGAKEHWREARKLFREMGLSDEETEMTNLIEGRQPP